MLLIYVIDTPKAHHKLSSICTSFMRFVVFVVKPWSHVPYLRKSKKLFEANITMISIIIGARPEIIKMTPIIHECQKRSLDFFVLHTGQHYSYPWTGYFSSYWNSRSRSATWMWAPAISASRRERLWQAWRIC